MPFDGNLVLEALNPETAARARGGGGEDVLWGVVVVTRFHFFVRGGWLLGDPECLDLVDTVTTLSSNHNPPPPLFLPLSPRARLNHQPEISSNILARAFSQRPIPDLSP